MSWFRPTLAALATAALAISGCMGDPEPAGQTQGTAFTRALATAYRDLAADSAAGTPNTDRRFFRERAERAATGETLAPRTLYDLEIPPDRVLNLADARIRLVGALRDNARRRRPELAATAQAQFDCWTIKTARGRTGPALADCRDGFKQAMGELEAGLGEETARRSP